MMSYGDVSWRTFKPRGNRYLQHLALRDPDARWAKVGLYNCPCFFAHDVGHPSPPHDGAGNGLRDDSKQRAFVRLDSAGRRRDLYIFGCSFDTRTVKPASRTSQVVLQFLSLLRLLLGMIEFACRPAA